MRIRARGRSFLALVLSPEAPLAAWLEELDAQMARSKGFFGGKPVILDLGLLAPDTPELDCLQDALTARGIRLIGIEGAERDWPAFRNWNWPEDLHGGRASGPVSFPEENAASEAGSAGNGASHEPLIIDKAVRSGQSVHYPEGDIVIIGPVSSGAEIIAGGSIHVYGTLRGRAIAGTGGRPNARIFASRFEAELLAIDGYYTIFEDTDPSLLGKAAQALLNENGICIVPITN